MIYVLIAILVSSIVSSVFLGWICFYLKDQYKERKAESFRLVRK